MKKQWNMKVTMEHGIGALLRSPYVNGLEDIEIRGQFIQITAKFGQNTAKSPEDLRSITITQTPVKNHQLILVSIITVFHISVSWWSFTGDWVTASLLKSPGLFSVFWQFSIMLLFGCSPLGRQFPNPPGPLITRAKSTNHNWYYCKLHVPQFFSIL